MRRCLRSATAADHARRLRPGRCRRRWRRACRWASRPRAAGATPRCSLPRRPVVDVITGSRFEGGELDWPTLLARYPVALLAPIDLREKSSMTTSADGGIMVSRRAVGVRSSTDQLSIVDGDRQSDDGGRTVGWRGAGLPSADGARLRLPDRRRRDSAVPTRAPAGSRTVSTASRAPSTPLLIAWSDDAWTGRQLAGGMIYELHIGTFTPDGTLDSAIDRLDHLVELGIDFVEVLPVNGFNGTHNWGYDGVLWYTVARGLRRTSRLPALRRRLPRARPRRHPGCRLQPPRAERQLPAPIRPVPATTASSNTWGTSINLDRAGGARLHHRQRADVDARLPRRRPAARRGARPRRHRARSTCWQELAERDRRPVSAAVGRPLTLIAESDLNDPKHDHARAKPAGTG